MPGGGCRLTRPTGSSHRFKPRRPAQAQRRRARYQARYLYRRVAATPCPAYRGLSQAQTSQARAGAAPPGKISGTVPVISPGGGCRLARPTGSSHRLIPRRPAQAQRRRAWGDLLPGFRMGIERRHHRRQRRFAEAMFRIVHPQAEAGLQPFI